MFAVILDSDAATDPSTTNMDSEDVKNHEKEAWEQWRTLFSRK
jgi:hypothetical protein